MFFTVIRGAPTGLGLAYPGKEGDAVALRIWLILCNLTCRSLKTVFHDTCWLKNYEMAKDIIIFGEFHAKYIGSAFQSIFILQTTSPVQVQARRDLRPGHRLQRSPLGGGQQGDQAEGEVNRNGEKANYILYAVCKASQ